MVTLVPLNPHVEGVVELNVTARPDVAVAFTVKDGSATDLFGGAAKLMVWTAFAMMKDCLMLAAAL